MKKNIITLFIFVLATATVSAQRMGFDSGRVSVQKRQANPQTEKMSPAERSQLIKQIRENMMVEDLKISEDKKESFAKIYSEYQDAQTEIKSQFRSDFNPETLSDDEARQKLHESFVVGEKLMENRRKYAEKLQQVLSPQQVLKLYQTEGAMREKLMDRKAGKNSNQGGNGFRPEQNAPPVRDRSEP